MPTQQLPDDLAANLRRARQLEHLADGLDQQHRAIAGTATLMLAAADAGWPIVAIAQATGLRYGAAKARIRVARDRYSDHRPAIVLDEPLPTLHPLDELRRPVTEREWLTLHEAAEHTGRSIGAIRAWRRRGILPNTRVVAPTRMLYLRADLDRVMRAPRYKRRGVDQKALREQLRGSRTLLSSRSDELQ